MNTKPSMKYRVVGGRNPQTGNPLFRPVVTDRETMYLDQVVQYALNAGYVRGQFHDMRGALNGFIEAIQQLGRDGKAVNLNNWLRIHAELTGTVGENRQLSERNEMNEEYMKHFKPDHMPARLCYGGVDLAEGCKIEIQVTAVKK